jgi:hypothetical protein
MDWTKLDAEAVEITRQYLRLVPPAGGAFQDRRAS